MNLVRLLRRRAGVTQQDLAAMAETSQSTIAAYETAAKSPTVRTVERLADSLGMTLVATCMSKLTREEQRSLAYHRGVVELLRNKPVPVMNRARRNLKKLSRVQPGAKMLFDRWEAWLQLPLEDLITNMVDPMPVAREMRQVSPFSGVLNQADRVRILKQFRQDIEQ